LVAAGRWLTAAFGLARGRRSALRAAACTPAASPRFVAGCDGGEKRSAALASRTTPPPPRSPAPRADRARPPGPSPPRRRQRASASGRRTSASAFDTRRRPLFLMQRTALVLRAQHRAGDAAHPRLIAWTSSRALASTPGRTCPQLSSPTALRARRLAPPAKLRCDCLVRAIGAHGSCSRAPRALDAGARAVRASSQRSVNVLKSRHPNQSLNVRFARVAEAVARWRWPPRCAPWAAARWWAAARDMEHAQQRSKCAATSVTR
jgi:hypothetical protein